jgi:two-component sensor histidine kinase
VYDDMDDSVMALQSYRKALELSKKLSNKKGEGSNLVNMGILYNYYGNYSKAFQYLSDALTVYEQLKFKEGISLCLSKLAIIYRDAPDKLLVGFGVNPNDRYRKVLQYQKRALALAQETGSVMRQSYRWENLFTTYKKQNDFRNALYAFQKSMAFRDSAINTTKSKEITQLEMRYEFSKEEDSVKAANDKRQALAAAAVKQEKTKKNFILTTVLILGIASVFIFIFYKRRRDEEEKKQEAEFKAHTNETELKALRAQMNPHFIFNSLSSISNYISKNNLPAADDYLTKFANLMRLVLENSDIKEVSLEDDLKVLELYMQLEAVRLDHKFTYKIKVADDIDKENTMMPPMILQPFVENSIWHGIAYKKGKGEIIITIKKDGNMINCTVDDDGVGLKHADQPAQRKSMGMKITKSRIEILNKIKNTNASVSLRSLQQGTRAEVRLPLQLNF